MSSNLTLRQAVHLALGAAGTLGSAPLVLAADAAGPADTTSQGPALTEIVVTGLRIRRGDAETANPFLVIDQKTIKETGITQVGDLLQLIPSISGSTSNPIINNGGRFRQQSIETA